MVVSGECGVGDVSECVYNLSAASTCLHDNKSNLVIRAR